jgi:hypothetical protein
MPRTKSSASWLSRHLSDPFVKQAQRDGYRSRSAYKLIELNEKDKLIRAGMRRASSSAKKAACSRPTFCRWTS